MQKQPSRGVPKLCSKFTATATLLKSHFVMGVLLQVSCIFSEHFFLRTPLDGCFCLCQITKNSGRLLNLFSQVKLKLKQLSNKFVENIEMTDDKAEIAKLFKEYFVNIVKKLGLLTKEQNAVSTENSLSEVKIAIAKYRNHHRINAVTEKIEKLGNHTFGFHFRSYEKTVKGFDNLKSRKVSQETDIPVKIAKENIDTVSYFLYHNFNNSFSCSTFSTGMKYAEVTPIHKKGR